MRAFTYDAAGNMTRDTRGTAQYNYTVSVAGRLARVALGTSVRADYVYDGKSRLASRVTQNQVGAGTVRYVHDNENRIIAELNATGTTLREYVWLEDIPVAVLDGSTNTANPSLFFVHADHLNRPVAMSNAARSWVWRAQYEPFGAVHSIVGPAANDNRFPGQMFQLEAGLAYNWHRHYDATLGRYTQPDPLGLQTLLSDGPSVYGYVGQSPLMWVDPFGLESSFFSQISGSFGDFGRNYRNMRSANTIGSDKYFHCIANCEASQRGKHGQQAARIISDVRELLDVCKGGTLKDSEADQYANFMGRMHGSMSQKSCTTLCGPFRPRGLSDRF